MADVKWIKLAVGFYKDRKIRQIRRKKNGDIYALIWIFLLCLAGDCNDGGRISVSDDSPFSVDDLADEFSTTPKLISEALQLFEELCLIHRDGDVIHITNWDKHQDVTKLDAIKKSNAERQRRYREQHRDSNVTRNVTPQKIVTPCNALDKEEDIDIDKDIEEEQDTSVTFGNSGTQKKEGIYNDAYMRSAKARAASAQILTDEFIHAKYSCSEIRDLYDVIYRAMEQGCTVDKIREAAQTMPWAQFAAQFMVN